MKSDSRIHMVDALIATQSYMWQWLDVNMEDKLLLEQKY